MITSFRVDGFKSLSRFSMSLREGLNILVGPNGAGKTNIINFFDFVGGIVNTDLLTAISRVGGAGTIFRKIGQDKYQNTISATLNGCVRADTIDHPPNDISHICYCYSFEIELSSTRDTLAFRSQKLKLAATNSTSTTKNRRNWDVVVEIATGKNGAYEILNLKVNPNFPTFQRTKRYSLKEEKSKNLATFLKEELGEFVQSEIGPIDSLTRILRRSLFFERIGTLIVSDLRGGTTYNISPNDVRVPEDSAMLPRIRADGSGLYATLFALEQRESNPSNAIRKRAISLNPLPERLTFSRIKKFFRLANPAIRDISVKNDPFDNQLKIRVELASGRYRPYLPLSALSDGTLKWMSLITAICTNLDKLSIEEPENFLHPHMQSEVLNIIRGQDIKNRIILMTTHSETLLNAATPAEVIVISFEDGRTRARRPEDVEQLTEIIKKTGFGMGYFYLTGALEDA